MKIQHWYRVVVAGTLAIGLSAATAEAGPLIDGSFAILSGFRAVNGTTGAATSMQNATGIDFLNLDLTNPAGSGQFAVVGATGDFEHLGFLSFGTIRDFAFVGSGGALPAPPIAAFESLLFGSLTFNLQSVAIQDQGPNIIHLTGTGLFNWSSAGYDPTVGAFDFYGTSTGASLAFNSADGTSPNPVPEPGSMMLLASGLVAGFAKFRKRGLPKTA